MAAGLILIKELFALPLANTRVEMDLLMEKVEADGLTTRIVVEVKNFREEGVYVSELQKSIGQYLLYREVRENEGYHYASYLAVPNTAYKEFLAFDLIRNLFQKNQICLLVFDPQDITFLQWNF